MMHAFERFGLLINDRVVQAPVGIASMAGIVDAAYVLDRAGHIGFAFIGGYSIDEPTIAAARSMAESGRKEFLSSGSRGGTEVPFGQFTGKRCDPGDQPAWRAPRDPSVPLPARSGIRSCTRSMPTAASLP